MQDVGGNWSCISLRTLLTAFKAELLSILGNILTISKLTSVKSDVKVLLI